MNIFHKLLILIGSIIFVCLISMGLIFHFTIEETIKRHFEERAVSVATTTAADQSIIQGFTENTPSDTIQPVSQNIREMTGASYVVIGNLDSERYSHHEEERIGGIMGTSNAEVFETMETVTYEGDGVSGTAQKAKAPIFNNQEELVGVSSVGFLIEDIDQEINSYQRLVWMTFLIIFLLGISGAFLLAKNIRDMMFGMEPHEISMMFKEKATVLESINDAIVSTNWNGEVRSANKKAKSLLGDNVHWLSWKTFMGNRQEESGILEPRKMTHEGKELLVEGALIEESSFTRGAVFTIREVSMIKNTAKDVSDIKEHSHQLRLNNHEFLNKMNTMYGLLQLKEYDKAMQLLEKEVQDRQALLSQVTTNVSSPYVAAALIGKAKRFKERHILFSIDTESTLTTAWPLEAEQDLATILNNLMENAAEAAYKQNGTNGSVHVSFTDFGSHAIFEIEDNGAGITKDEEDAIFQEGYSTKLSNQHGYGLTIVSQLIQKHGGDIQLFSERNYTRFTVIFPKPKEESS